MVSETGNWQADVDFQSRKIGHTLHHTSDSSWDRMTYLHVVLINLAILDINTSQTVCKTDQPQAAGIPDLRVCQWDRTSLTPKAS